MLDVRRKVEDGCGAVVEVVVDLDLQISVVSSRPSSSRSPMFFRFVSSTAVGLKSSSVKSGVALSSVTTMGESGTPPVFLTD